MDGEVLQEGPSALQTNYYGIRFSMSEAEDDEPIPTVPDIDKSRRSRKGDQTGSNNGGDNSAVPLTRNDIPVIVQEVARQLRPEGPNVFPPLVPSMFYH